ncbi:MAG TPA: cofactor-independent phosphoglycerate mutase [Phycisphaerae bacterium]|nr:cofactor-independent phosphoglycerate mutase [Phycisphaerae bacterium]
MKYALIIPDGAADVPLDELRGRTPFEAAETPHLDWIASHGRLGTVNNIPDGLPAGSDVAILSVLGYDPRQYYTGRAPLEAAAQGLKVRPDEWIFRCNFVTIVEGVMEDYSAGHISTEEASALIGELNRRLANEKVRFYPGVGYRHLMTLRGDCDVQTTPPHDILGQAVAGHLPEGAGAEALQALTERSQRLLADHEINTIRRDLGDNPATSIWLWGEGKMPSLPSFAEKYSLAGKVVTAVDLVAGIAALIGWERIDVPGATGFLDTNYAGKGAAAVKALDDGDFVCVHVEAPDEAGHNADAGGKVAALESIDRHIVGPVLQRLKAEGDDWRILVLPDHPTPCTVRTHTRDAVPFAIAGARIITVVHDPFTEAAAARSDLHIARGHEMMEYFLTVR